jgi:fimbrial chaperone protein
MKSLLAPLHAFVASAVFMTSMPAAAGDFVVTPIRLELSASQRSGVITVRNDGKEKLAFQMQAMEWTQGDAGQDLYKETAELIFFPKVMSVLPGEEGVIRIGTKFPSVASERTYRLFIEELPVNAQQTDKGAHLNVLIRFGAPIFIKPRQPQDRLAIESVELAHAELSLLAHNTGNQNQIVEGISVKGEDGQGHGIYALTLSDRYLLAGTSKRYKTAIQKDVCDRMTRLSVEFKTDKTTQVRKLDVDKAMCL